MALKEGPLGRRLPANCQHITNNFHMAKILFMKHRPLPTAVNSMLLDVRYWQVVFVAGHLRLLIAVPLSVGC